MLLEMYPLHLEVLLEEEGLMKEEEELMELSLLTDLLMWSTARMPMI